MASTATAAKSDRKAEIKAALKALKKQSWTTEDIVKVLVGRELGYTATVDADAAGDEYITDYRDLEYPAYIVFKKPRVSGLRDRVTISYEHDWLSRHSATQVFEYLTGSGEGQPKTKASLALDAMRNFNSSTRIDLEVEISLDEERLKIRKTLARLERDFTTLQAKVFVNLIKAEEELAGIKLGDLEDESRPSSAREMQELHKELRLLKKLFEATGAHIPDWVADFSGNSKPKYVSPEAERLAKGFDDIWQLLPPLLGAAEQVEDDIGDHLTTVGRSPFEVLLGEDGEFSVTRSGRNRSGVPAPDNTKVDARILAMIADALNAPTAKLADGVALGVRVNPAVLRAVKKRRVVIQRRFKGLKKQAKSFKRKQRKLRKKK